MTEKPEYVRGGGTATEKRWDRIAEALAEALGKLSMMPAAFL